MWNASAIWKASEPEGSLGILPLLIGNASEGFIAVIYPLGKTR